MNMEEVARELAKQAGLDWHSGWPVGDDEPNRFEVLVKLAAAHALMNIDPSKFIGGYQEGFEAGVAKKREECAKLCDRFQARDVGMQPAECAGAIRARSKA
jgi:hypothetical protein